jgi:hypothetical protein
MSRRIGELLVKRGLVTDLQLDKALKTQLILGGHLGTCLIELGFIDEESFGRMLAEMHGVRYATPDQLVGIAPDVIQIFSSRMVEKYRAIPIKLEDNTLHLAVVDPKTLGRLSTLTGHKIVPWIVPELRIYEAMEAYYNIPRRGRYIRLCQELGHRKVREPLGETVHESSEPSVPRDVQLGETAEPRAAGTLTAVDLGEEYGYGKSWRDVADELFEERTDTDGAHEHEEEKPRREPARVHLIRTRRNAATEVFRRMSRAEDKDDLARAVLDYAAERMNGAILFTVRAETASIWDWTGLKLKGDGVRSLRFPVTAGSVFALMLGDGQYRGPVPDRTDCKWFYSALQFEVPDEIVLLPVYLNDRLVAIFYGDGGSSGEILGTTDSYANLTQKLGLALNMLVLKMKILA